LNYGSEKKHNFQFQLFDFSLRLIYRFEISQCNSAALGYRLLQRDFLCAVADCIDLDRYQEAARGD
jgi:hypothetical protein